MKTTDFKELTKIYLDVSQDCLSFEDVNETRDKVVKKLCNGAEDFETQNSIDCTINEVTEIYQRQGFIRGYQIAMKIAIEVMQGAIEEKERVCV